MVGSVKLVARPPRRRRVSMSVTGMLAERRRREAAMPARPAPRTMAERGWAEEVDVVVEGVTMDEV